jgi:hypothetical protein
MCGLPLPPLIHGAPRLRGDDGGLDYALGWPTYFRCSVTYSVNTPSLDDVEVYVFLDALAATELNQTFLRKEPRQSVTRVSSGTFD